MAMSIKAIAILGAVCITICACTGLRVQDGENPAVASARYHFVQQGDSLKLAALDYLLENMSYHGYVEFHLVDSLDKAVDLDVLSHQDLPAVRAAIDSLERLHGELRFKRRQYLSDEDAVTAAFLIDNVELTFDAWKLPWARHLSYSQLRDYVLPYRGSNEPLENWRQPLYERYRSVGDTMQDPSDPMRVSAYINADLRSWFGFDERFYLHPTDQGYSQMCDTRLGRCEDMTNLAIFSMRAVGLAVTSDYTPYWANCSNNHAWNAILAPDGRAVPFMGCEADPGDYHLGHRLAKVYRHTFSEQSECHAAVLAPEEQVPRWLGGRNYIDVTRDYVPVSHVRVVPMIDAPAESLRFLYLCVFNDGDWKAIHWALVENGAAVFTDMGRNVCYLPAWYHKGELCAAGAPFILNEAGKSRNLNASGNSVSFLARSTTRDHFVQATVDNSVHALESGVSYELLQWRDTDWVSLGSQTAGDGALRFPACAEDGLYWLVQEEGRRQERIFTLKNGEQVWW